MNFNDLGLHESLLKAVQEQNYTTPTPIQAQAIPAVMRGSDMLASAQTGTGKTAGFTLPLLHRLVDRPRAESTRPLALVLTPTRELAAQVHDSIQTYGRHLPLRSAVVFGGVKINPQITALRRGVDILVATPGRLLDLHQQNAVRLDRIEILVLDEADRMLDMGFINDIRRVLGLLPKKRQNLMFSATYSPDIQKLAKGLLNNPVEVNVAPVSTAAERVVQTLHPVDKGRKAELLSHLIRDQGWYQALVFSRTKHGANKLVKQLDRDGIQAGAIHGNKSQAQRTKVLDQFKRGKLQILVATDIAARGIDIDQLPQVVNFDLPDVPEDYVHRIGRTARAGAEGQAVSLVSAGESKQLKAIERLLKKRIERIAVAGFDPRDDLDNPPREERKPAPGRPASRPGNGRRGPQRATGEDRSGGRGRNSRRGSGQNASGSDRPARRSGSGARVVASR
ncbi:MAG: DEAD/DEAH box helicase [Pseudohongiellaceae bacterium]